jgi:hypothetical protein
MKKSINWLEVDFEKSTSFLAAKHNVNKSTISRMRKRIRHDSELIKRLTTSSSELEILEKITDTEWENSSDSKLEERYKIAEGKISSFRKTHKKPLASNRWASWKRETKFAGKEIDWQKPNKTIAKELGSNPHNVSAMRKKYAPETVRKRKPR